jgi:formate C-acetyltransferase
MANASQRAAALYAPNPYRSNLIDGCIEKGLDLKNRGPIYGHGQILAEGLADAVDSIAAVKHFIYDTKKYTMRELIDALTNDFVGYEELHFDFSHYEKFGNNCDKTDEIYKDVTEHFYKYLLTKDTFRGGKYGGGCSPFNRAAAFGIKTGALPNGKKKESAILADSIGAVPGCDTKGITALLNSVMSVDQTLAKSGHILNLKFNKELFSTKENKELFLSIVKTYFENRGQQLSVSVISHEDLLCARRNPELYKNIIVRVGGYSDYFVSLSPELQENIIQRTALSFS